MSKIKNCESKKDKENKTMKNEMNAENMNLVNEEKLEEVSGGFSNRRPYIDGYADTPDVVPPVKNINSDGINMDDNPIRAAGI